MARNTGLNIIIAGDAKGATRAFRQVRGEAVSLDDSLTKAKNSAQAVMAAYAGARFFTDAVQSASDLEEASTKVNQVFAGGSEEIQQWSESSATAFGLSRAAALEAAGTYGNLFQAFGVGRNRATEMSKSLVELAADLASFNNTSIDDALVALRSGLAGEIEPMRRYGASLTDAALREQALAMGLEVGTGALDARTKALAAYEIIMRDTALAQGDFERTSDGLANQQRILAAEWENAKAELGTGLMPVMRAGVTVGRELAQAWGAIPGPVQVGILAFGGMAMVLPKVASGARAARDGMDMFRLGLAGVTEKGAGASNAVGGFVGRMGGVTPVAAAAGGALAAIALVYVQIQQQAAKAKANITDLQNAIRESGDVSTSVAEKLALTFSGTEGGFTGLRGSARDMKADLDEAGIGLADVERALSGTGDEWERFQARVEAAQAAHLQAMIDAGENVDLSVDGNRYEELIINLEALRSQTQRASEQERERKAIREELNLADEDAADASTGLTSAVEDQKSAYERALEALEAYQKRTRDRVDTARALTEAERSTREAQDELADALRAAAGDSEEYRDAREGIVDAEQGVRDAQERVADAQRDAADAQRELNEERVEARQRLVDMAQAARDAALAEADATLKVKEARNELDRVRRNRQSLPLERERAELEVRQAEEDARKAAEDAKRAATDNADAQRRGVEGDAGVVQARKRVEDANRRVAEAERGVADARAAVSEAERRAAAVIATARERVAGAVRAVETAMFDEAEAAGDAASAQFGAARGAQEHARRLREVRDLISPDSDLRRWLDDYITALEKAGLRDLGSRVAAGEISLAAAEQEIIAGRGNSVPAPTVNNVTNNSVTLINQGTPAQQLRNQRHTTRDELDRIARGTRG